MINYNNLVNNYKKKYINTNYIYYPNYNICNTNLYNNNEYQISCNNIHDNIDNNIDDNIDNNIDDNIDDTLSNVLILDNDGKLNMKSDVNNIIKNTEINTKEITICDFGVLNLCGKLNCQQIIIKGNSTLKINKDGNLNIQKKKL
jgi:hypothetical protein